jgi:hypothetical protein
MIAHLSKTTRIYSPLFSTASKSVLILCGAIVTSAAASSTPKLEAPKSASDDSKAMYGQSCHKDVVVYVRAARVQHTAQSGQIELRWKYFLRMAHKGYSSSRPGLRFQLEPGGQVAKQVTGFSGYVILPPKEGYEAQLGIDNRPSAMPLLPMNQWLTATKMHCDPGEARQ